MIFGDRHFPLCVLSRQWYSGVGVHPSVQVYRYGEGFLFCFYFVFIFFIFLFFTMSGNNPGVESLGAWDTEHLATCGTFQHDKELPRSKCQQHPHWGPSINSSLFMCSCCRGATSSMAFSCVKTQRG